MTHSDKKSIILKLVEVPDSGKRNFWGREIKSLNALLESFPEENFWKGLTFPVKFDSIIVLRSGYYAEELKKKYKRYKYIIPNKSKIVLGDKTGKDYVKIKKNKTLRDFLS